MVDQRLGYNLWERPAGEDCWELSLVTLRSEKVLMVKAKSMEVAFCWWAELGIKGNKPRCGSCVAPRRSSEKRGCRKSRQNRRKGNHPPTLPTFFSFSSRRLSPVITTLSLC